jgi:VIT1/CCC1 family predicted Fe2+/Mn2+ transporter
MSDINEIQARLAEVRAQAAALESELELAKRRELEKELDNLSGLVADRDALDGLVAKLNKLIESQGLTLIVRRQRRANVVEESDHDDQNTI